MYIFRVLNKEKIKLSLYGQYPTYTGKFDIEKVIISIINKMQKQGISISKFTESAVILNNYFIRNELNFSKLTEFKRNKGAKELLTEIKKAIENLFKSEDIIYKIYSGRFASEFENHVFQKTEEYLKILDYTLINPNLYKIIRKGKSLNNVINLSLNIVNYESYITPIAMILFKFDINILNFLKFAFPVIYTELAITSKNLEKNIRVLRKLLEEDRRYKIE